MITTFKMTTYPDTESETHLVIKVGPTAEIDPIHHKMKPTDKPSYSYNISVEGETGRGYMHLGFSDHLGAMAGALLRAAAYGNGGFPLDNTYLRRR